MNVVCTSKIELSWYDAKGGFHLRYLKDFAAAQSKALSLASIRGNKFVELHCTYIYE